MSRFKLIIFTTATIIDDYLNKILIDNDLKKAFARSAIIKLLNLATFVPFSFYLRYPVVIILGFISISTIKSLN